MIVADVADAGVPGYLAETAVGRFGGLDILVGNGGGPPAMRALEVDDAALARALNENLQAMVRLVRAAVPGMVARRWGRICLITSSAVKEPMPALALSNTARTGLWAWAKTAAQDLRQHGVTLNLACSGYHATDRLKAIGGAPDGLLAGDPADFGKIVAFLCSEPVDSSAAPRCKSMVPSRYSAFCRRRIWPEARAFLQHPLTAADWAARQPGLTFGILS